MHTLPSSKPNLVQSKNHSETTIEALSGLRMLMNGSQTQLKTEVSDKPLGTCPFPTARRGRRVHVPPQSRLNKSSEHLQYTPMPPVYLVSPATLQLQQNGTLSLRSAGNKRRSLQYGQKVTLSSSLPHRRIPFSRPRRFSLAARCCLPPHPSLELARPTPRR